MVVEICSENCGVTMSPRISFSHDFSQLDVIPVEKHPLRSNSSSGLSSSNNTSIDFDFCVQQESLDHESSSADELFSDGRILPIQIKNKNNNNNNSNSNKNKNIPLNQKGLQQQQAITTQSPLPPLTRKNSRRESTKKELMSDEVDDQKQSSNSNSKSFWRFKRSSSCGSGGYGRSLCPLPLLSRSNSTGSSPSVKRVPTISSSSKDGTNYNIKQNSHKSSYYYSHNTSTTRSSTSSSQSFGPNNNHQIKPPLKKGRGPYGSSNNNNSVRVNPVLNVPPVNLFGFGSIFSNSRDKCKKK